jgi:hypothetical protein
MSPGLADPVEGGEDAGEEQSPEGLAGEVSLPDTGFRGGF